MYCTSQQDFSKRKNNSNTNKMSTTTEYWKHLPILIQRSMTYCRTSSVVEQLKNNAPHLTSLRLVGVEDNTNVKALCDALESNTTLRHVSICGSFLQTLSLSSGTLENDDDTTTNSATLQCPIMMLFRAIGCLPNLNTLTLQGSEDSDAFPVSAVTLLLQTHSSLPNGGSSSTLKELICQYVDIVGNSSEQFAKLGHALCKCSSLTHVSMMSLSVHGPMIITLDPIISSLNHCERVDIGMRYRRPFSGGANNKSSHVSAEGLTALLTPPLTSTSPHNKPKEDEQQQQQQQHRPLKRLELRRRIHLDEGRTSSIMCSLSNPLACLEELHLDDVHFGTDVDAVKRCWQDMANMLEINVSLRVLDMSFSTGGFMDRSIVAAITGALQKNRILRSLSMRTSSLSRVPPETDSWGTSHPSYWVELLEHYNYTLEEVLLTTGGITNDAFSQYHQKLQFYLQLNRQQVLLPNGKNCALRTLLREHHGAIPQKMVFPCIMAASRVGSSEGNRNGGLNGLFYLFSQEPSLLMSYQNQQKRGGSLHNTITKKISFPSILRETAALDADADEVDVVKTPSSKPPCGRGPQLLLLDDEIVTLW